MDGHAYLILTSNRYPYVVPKSPPSVQIASDLGSSDYPLILPARCFKSDEIINLPCVRICETELIRYEEQPELLQKETFVSFDVDGTKCEVYRVSAFLTTDREKIYYLVFADEGAEAVAWSSYDFFDLLLKSQRVST